MGASAYVGRVGALAVVLGVGVAVATGPSVAWATEGDTTTSTNAQSASEGSPTANAPTEDKVQTSEGEDATSEDPTSDDIDITEDTEEALTDPDLGEVGGDPDDPDDPDEPGDAVEDDEDGPDGPADNGDMQISTGHTSAVTPEPEESRITVTDTSTDTKTVEAFDSVQTLDTRDDPALDETGADTDLTFVTQSFSTTAQEDTVPVALAGPQTAAQQPLLQRVVVGLLSSLGIGAFASNLPGAPVWSPFVMAVLGLGSRREFSQPVDALARTVGSVPVAALAMADFATAAVLNYPGTTRKPVKVSTNTHWIEYLTGKGNLNNTTTRFAIGGTDLGIMWDNGIPDDPATTDVNESQVLIAFGDTFQTAPRSGVWRFNTLFRSADGKLNDGLYVPNGVPFDIFSGSPMERPNWSDPILPSPGQPPKPPYAIGPEVTIIPTAGISTRYGNELGARQYMSFMSIRSWDTAGRWTTNYSGVAYSDDNGQTWRIAPTSIRTAAAGRATVPYVAGNENFQQGAFVKPPEGSAESDQGWVYSYGTPSGRKGTVYLSRVQETQILDATKYEYWNGSSWVANAPSAATPLFPGKTTSFFGFFKSTKYPTVSEMSVQYNPYLGKYVMLYGDQSNRIVLRTADSPEGLWSEPKVLVGAWTLSGKYAPYIHPWSGTTNLPEAEQQYLFWNLSTWGNYQVRLMRTDLTKVKV
ncbi:DUF4185 domain-containing protein [Mycolicibacterium sp. XJ1819]